MLANGALQVEGNAVAGASGYRSLGLDSTRRAAMLQMDNDFFLGGASEDVGDNCFFCFTNTLPVDDAYSVDGALETQLVDPTAETQVMDDVAYDKCLTLKFSRESDADKAEVNAKSTVNNVNPVPDTEYPCRHGEIASGTPFDKCTNTSHHSGSVLRGFTSIRVASVRASGLAAQAKKKVCASSSEPQYHRQDMPSLSGLTNSVTRISWDILPNNSQRICEGSVGSDKRKVRSTTVRKLFREDDANEVGLSEIRDNSVKDVGIPKSVSFMGLVYDGDHEPGELSQSHALESVEKLIKLNAFELEKCFSPQFQMKQAMKAASSARGCRDLAQKSAVRSVDGICEIFDWNEKCENDSGGGFFATTKDLCFADGVPDRKCLGGNLKPRDPHLDVEAKYVVEKERKDSRENLADPLYSDSKMLQQENRNSFSKKEQHFSPSLKKDLFSIKSNLLYNDMDGDFLGIENIGPDTQKAVEAMEDLCFEVHLSETGSDVCKKGANNGASRDSASKRPRKTSCSKRSKETSKKRPYDASRVNLEFKTTVDKKRNVTAKCSSDNALSISKSRGPGPCTPKQSEEGFFESSGVSNDGAHGSLIESSHSQENHLDQWYSSDVTPSHQYFSNGRSRNAVFTCKEYDRNIPDQMTSKDAKAVSCLEYSTMRGLETFPTASTSLDDCIKVNDGSPICMGGEYPKQFCRKRSSKLYLKREIDNLVPQPSCQSTALRKRRYIAHVKVLFSQHLDVDVIKHQKRILARLGGESVSSISDATHFVADEFTRTRNMLEAIAFGKPVVTHLWIESCGQANCLIDEKNYILRDSKKEMEFGFCLPASLERAGQHSLLQGRKVLITPNVSPGKDILANLVKAVGGLPVERLGRSVLKDGRFMDDLLILSCNEDYDVCVPFIEKGATVYSTELLLNGIVKQRLEYERHCLYGDKVERTRSRLWAKTKGRNPPVRKNKRC